ncbi:Membrane protein involved in the export of O-antigen and teichoic acid [Frankia canadensis]|uniref:Membrane protein involved in the export of O-antigen and teichoic acid n=1 Tax=Frankia canadensis TaxID=1836972 RepID=A0A2I2KKT5_9ACTN|nr:Membrane protein involved in the export of O-antigen and teichoic acid [Frankia canadensis]SOU53570.1 Membrane protein involved in the export of O-antigen and teichoic acid [Frankia canadensis]
MPAAPDARAQPAPQAQAQAQAQAAAAAAPPSQPGATRSTRPGAAGIATTAELAELRRRLGMPMAAETGPADPPPRPAATGGDSQEPGPPRPPARGDRPTPGTGPGPGTGPRSAASPDPAPALDPALHAAARRDQRRRNRGEDSEYGRQADPPEHFARDTGWARDREADADGAHRQGHGYGHGSQFGYGQVRDPRREHGPARAWEQAGWDSTATIRRGDPRRDDTLRPDARGGAGHDDVPRPAGRDGGGAGGGLDGGGSRGVGRAREADARLAGPARDGRPGGEPSRRVEPFDHERTQIIRGLRSRRVPGAESFRVPHAPTAEGLIPMSGTMTGEFFLGSLIRPETAAPGRGDRLAGGARGHGGGAPTGGASATEPADYGLADLSEEIGAGGRHRVERTTHGSSRSRAIWTLVDQVLSSGTNAVMSFVIANSVSSTSEFGAFGIAFAIFSLMIGFSKAAGTSPLGIKFADASPRVFRAAGAAGTGTAFVIGLLSGVVTLVVGLGVGGAVGKSLVAMGLVFPALLLQDAWRQVFFAEGRPAAAAINDGVWAVVQFAAIFALIVRDVTTSWAMLLAWGGAAAVAAVLGIYQAGYTPATGQVRAWLAEHRDINGYMSAEYLTVQGAQQASTLLLGTVGAIDLVGALRGVQTLLGPTTILAVGIVSWAIPEFSRRTDMTARARLRAAYALSGVIVGVGVAWGTIFLVLPPSIGHALLDDTWEQTHHLLALSIVQQAGPAATVGPACMLYALGKAKLTFRANLILAPQLLVYPVVGLELGGATGAVVGYIAAFWITVPFWFLLVASAAREAEREAGAAAEDPAQADSEMTEKVGDVSAAGPGAS